MLRLGTKTIFFFFFYLRDVIQQATSDIIPSTGILNTFHIVTTKIISKTNKIHANQHQQQPYETSADSFICFSGNKSKARCHLGWMGWSDRANLPCRQLSVMIVFSRSTLLILTPKNHTGTGEFHCCSNLPYTGI